MPRKSNSSRKIYYPKKKWAPHFKIFSCTTASIITSICDNTLSTASPTPNIIKVKHIKVDADINVLSEPAQGSQGFLFVIYLPEGMAPTTYNTLGSYVEQHPEYIMCWSALRFAIGDGQVSTDDVHLVSRISRNLNSGDKIAIALLSNVSLQVNGAVSFVTCAN